MGPGLMLQAPFVPVLGCQGKQVVKMGIKFKVRLQPRILFRFLGLRATVGHNIMQATCPVEILEILFNLLACSSPMLPSSS
jgi:hypothetical protein